MDESRTGPGSDRQTRRSFLARSTGVVLSGNILLSAARRGDSDDEISPVEDLMREHGVLKRVLLIYSEISDRLKTQREVPPLVLSDSADVIRRFIEEYHEILEETHLFPRFRSANRMVELVDTLALQHRRGRLVTQKIIDLSTRPFQDDPALRRQLTSSLDSFIRMYNPHEAREDTVLFPSFHTLVSRNEYDSLGEEFERKERELFGEEGFQGMVERVGDLEKKLGIFNLAQFTPGG